MEAQAANTAESFWKLVEQFRCTPEGTQCCFGTANSLAASHDGAALAQPRACTHSCLPWQLGSDHTALMPLFMLLPCCRGCHGCCTS